MLYSMKKTFFVIAALLSLGLFGAHHAYALKVDPALVSVSLSPGESKVLSVTLTNDAKASVAIQPKMFAATAGNNEAGFPAYTPANQEDTLANWITINGTAQTTLQADEAKKVDITLSLPQDAAPGGHYAAIGWGVLSADPSADGAVSVQGQIMTNIALDVPGEVFEKGGIASLSTKDKLTKYDRLPIDFSVRVINEGNRHFKPTGNVVIRDMFGRVAATLPVNDGIGGGNVLPQSTREFKASWKEGFALGKYTATADLLLGGAGSASEAYTFWVLPIMLLAIWGIAALIIIVILVMIVLKVVRSKKK